MYKVTAMRSNFQCILCQRLFFFNYFFVFCLFLCVYLNRLQENHSALRVWQTNNDIQLAHWKQQKPAVAHERARGSKQHNKPAIEIANSLSDVTKSKTQRKKERKIDRMLKEWIFHLQRQCLHVRARFIMTSIDVSDVDVIDLLGDDGVYVCRSV